MIGFGRVIKTGIDYTKWEVVVIMEADNSYMVSTIDRFG
jgi:hypothetical protein